MKQNDSYQDFDKQVQQLLGQASEPVPEGAWEAIAARLAAGANAGAGARATATGVAVSAEAGAAGKAATTGAAAGSARKAIILKWVRRTGFAVAGVAAAVLLTVTLWNRDEQTLDDPLAVVTEQNGITPEQSVVADEQHVVTPEQRAVAEEQRVVTPDSNAEKILAQNHAQPQSETPAHQDIAQSQASVTTTNPTASSAKTAKRQAVATKQSTAAPKQHDVTSTEGLAQIGQASPAPIAVVPGEADAAIAQAETATAETPIVEVQAAPLTAEAPVESQSPDVQAQPIDWDNLPELEDEQQANSRKKYQPNGFHLAAYTNALSNFTSKKSGQYTGYSGVSGSARPDHSYVEETGESNYSIPLTFGLNVTYDILPRFSMGIGINYTRLSRHFAGTYYQLQTDGTFDAGTDYDNVYNIQQFIGIPITAYFHIVRTKRINFYVYANGTVEKCLANTWTANNRAVNYNEPVKGAQFNAGAGIGVDFMLAPLVSIYLDPNVKYYFDLNQPKSIRTKQPFMLGFEAGVRFHL